MLAEENHRGTEADFGEVSLKLDYPFDTHGRYHYKINLLPRGCFGDTRPVTLSEADVERGQNFTSGWWAFHPPSIQLLAALRKLLPTDKSWGETEEYISAENFGSDVRIWKNGEQVWGITFRFSPVADSWSLMQQFLAIARDEQCFLLEAASGVVIEPDEQTIRERLATSRAMQFVRDPAGTIVQAAKT